MFSRRAQLWSTGGNWSNDMYLSCIGHWFIIKISTIYLQSYLQFIILTILRQDRYAYIQRHVTMVILYPWSWKEFLCVIYIYKYSYYILICNNHIWYFLMERCRVFQWVSCNTNLILVLITMPARSIWPYLQLNVIFYYLTK